MSSIAPPLTISLLWTKFYKVKPFNYKNFAIDWFFFSRMCISFKLFSYFLPFSSKKKNFVSSNITIVGKYVFWILRLIAIEQLFMYYPLPPDFPKYHQMSPTRGFPTLSIPCPLSFYSKIFTYRNMLYFLKILFTS